MRTYFLSSIVTLFILSACTTNGKAQQRPNKKNSATLPATKQVITAKPAPALPKDLPKPYAEVVPASAKTSKGFMLVHQISDRYLFEIPDSIIGRSLFTVNRVTKSAQDWRNPLGGLCSYGNDWIGQSMFRFEKSGQDKIALRLISNTERAENANPDLTIALARNNFEPIYAIFPVKSYGKDGKSAVIDLTDYLNSDNPVFGYLSGLKMLAMPGIFAPERSFLNSVKAYPKNIEVFSTRTYAAGSTVLTGEYNSSIILLSKIPMKSRALDERVGFFGVTPADYKSFDAEGHISNKANIWRWRLEPKPEDRARYFKGELVEPAQPIIFYIDPATPKKWIPYLIAGVNDWQAAFEKAGFKNAIMAKEVDPADTTFDINDSRHNVMVYKASAIGNAMGHSLQDPRSGEILESHIQWYHSVMEILYKWYFVQAGAIDTAAQKPKFSDELMGQLIRFVSSHEVGHAVGLRHNWGSSSTTTIAQLRDRAWVEAHGHTPSIMDYARFNYVAQPEDHITQSGIFPRIGDYDTWAIQWGYSLMPDSLSPVAEKTKLDEWVTEKVGADKRLRFGIGDDPSAKYPQNQREDLSDDAVMAGTYGIKNLKRIKKNLMQWTQVPGAPYDRTADIYKALVDQYDWYIKHATAYIGGMVFTPRSNTETGAVYGFEPALKQKQALAFLNRELFNTPEWLRDDKLYRLSSADFSSIQAIQKRCLQQLLDEKLFNKLRAEETANATLAYTLPAFLTDLYHGIFSELRDGKSISANRRFLQKIYVNELTGLITTLSKTDGDGASLVKAQAKQLLLSCKTNLKKPLDKVDRAHLEDLALRLDETLYRPMRLSK
ncbi:zinc-dependent metalloprotease [Pedobacter miscanthi]|uniref:zinc-dependent metalloprotease n=1 Tax=Pedobacter miscanthi TaxID=2259170 RepID=UPI0029308F99|nr:zinc-dependent metalloprotease [Pedobacter miscanthi]